jgi:hypothetical protein
MRWILCAAFSGLLLLGALTHVGFFAPVEGNVNAITKIHFGIMLRCSCLHGWVNKWTVVRPDYATAFMSLPNDYYETWDVWLDGKYFQSRVR